MSRLLIVDDEPNLLYSLKKSLESCELEVMTAETAEQGVEAVSTYAPDAVILDVRLPDMSGLDAFSEIHRLDPRIPVIIFTAFSTTETAIEAMKRGAYEYLLKPVEFDRLYDVVQRALEIGRMNRAPAAFEFEAHAIAENLVGQSRAMQEVYKATGQVARQDVNVLILGESGTGKEMVARAVFEHSHRSNGPFLAINCAALPEMLLESELFGHEKGSFTGADRRRVGKFEEVDGGTIFLDEIGDMTPATQSKVLRLLQDGTFARVGSNSTIRVNVRVIAATNRDLNLSVQRNEFREDLYYRLRVFTIELPPLRQRKDDIAILVEHFIKLFNQELGRNVRSVQPAAMRSLERYDWPGNVRELQSAVKYALVRNIGEVLTEDSLPATCRGTSQASRGDSASPLDPASIRQLTLHLLAQRRPDIYRRIHDEVDRMLLPEVLNHVDGNQVHASELLGIARSTLRAKVSDLRLKFEKRLMTDPAPPG